MARSKAPLLPTTSSPLGDPLAALPIQLGLNRQSGQPLHSQLAEQLRLAVLAGALPADLRLPGSRSLAQSLGVTRGVVTEAYAELVAEGTLSAAVGSGTRVSAMQPCAKAPTQSGPAWFVAPPPPPVDDAVMDSGIHFKTGVTTSATLDERAWRQAWAYAAAQGIRGDYSDAAGESILRGALAAFVGRSRGLPASADDVLVTAGTLQALNLIVRGILPPASAVLFENPGYRAARQVFVDAGHTVHPLPLDQDGPILHDLPPAKAVYVTPSHQFPLGVRMSLPRRLALLSWAAQHDALIIEDDYNGEFRYGAPPLPPLASLEQERGRVLYIGTLSKVLTPAVRTGFLVAPPALRPALIRARTLLDFGHPLPVQHALTHLLTHGELDKHVRRSRRWHAQVRETLTRELAELAPQAALSGIEAGLHVCLNLRDLDPEQVKAELAQRGVYVSTLAEFSVGEGVPNALLLGYGGLTVKEAEAGAKELVRVVREMTPNHPLLRTSTLSSAKAKG